MIYIIPFGIVALCYIFINKRNIKKIFIEIGFFVIGIIIGFLPLLIYATNILNLIEIIYRYLLIAMSYSSEIIFKFNKDFIIKFIIPSIVLFIVFINLLILQSNKELIISFIYFLGFLIVLIISKRFYIYYSYFFISFIPFIIILFDKILNEKNYLKFLFIILILCFFIFDFTELLIAKGFGLPKEYDYQYSFYNDFKDNINEDTLVLNLLNTDNLVTKYFDCQPNYKYFNTTNLPYKEFKYLFDENLNKIKNKEFDYISVLCRFSENNGLIKRVFLVSDNVYEEKDYLNETFKYINDNYKVVIDYPVIHDYRGNKNTYISIFEKK